jgi:hypothetical protein
VIPSVIDVLGAHAFVARRYGFRGTLHVAGIENALAMARGLATSERDEPAALFYALAHFPKALGDSWRTLPVVLAVNQARRTGQRLTATRDDLLPLFVPIASDAMDFATVRAWFEKRLESLTNE